MKYNMKYFEENRVVISEEKYGAAYDLDGHRIGISPCQSATGRYVSVFVDGETVATRTKPSGAVRLALAYMNEHYLEHSRNNDMER